MDRYRKVKEIGKGAFGAAILVHARNDPKAQYVIKQVDVSRLKPKERDEAKKEIKLLASFHHPNIVRYRDSFLETGVLHIVMDFAEGGDLAPVVGNHSSYFQIGSESLENLGRIVSGRGGDITRENRRSVADVVAGQLPGGRRDLPQLRPVRL